MRNHNIDDFEIIETREDFEYIRKEDFNSLFEAIKELETIRDLEIKDWYKEDSIDWKDRKISQDKYVVKLIKKYEKSYGRKVPRWLIARYIRSFM